MAHPSILDHHVLWFLQPIKSKPKSQQLSFDSPQASSYYDKISVQEAFFYLVSEVGAGRWQYTNNMEPDEQYCEEVYHGGDDIEDDVLDDQDAQNGQNGQNGQNSQNGATSDGIRNRL